MRRSVMIDAPARFSVYTPRFMILGFLGKVARIDVE